TRQTRDQFTDLGDARRVVIHGVVRDTAHLRVCLGAAKRLTVDYLPRGTLHQVGTTESHEGRSLHHENDIGQGREIRAARDALAHYRGDLRYAQVTSHHRVVIEDATRAELPRKYSALIRQIHSCRVDQIHDRDRAPHRYFLRAQNLPDRLRPP